MEASSSNWQSSGLQSRVLGVRIPPGLPLILHMKVFSRITKFITEVKVELQKVSWSDRNELIGSTGVVIISTALLAIFIATVDLIISRFISILLR